jgi:hypothetical protein
VPPPLDTPVPEKVAARSNDGWPTSLLTIEVPVYQPRGTPSRARPAPAPATAARNRPGLTCLAATVALVSVALAVWQLYWLLESTERGRALFDAAGAAVAWVAAVV